MSDQLQTPLIQLQGAIDQRVQQESDFTARFLQGPSDAEKSLVAAIRQIEGQRQTWLDGLDQHYQQAAAQVNDEINDQLIDAEGQFQSETGEISRVLDAERDEVESKFQDSTWVTSSLMDDTADDSPKREFEKLQFSIEKQREELASIVTTLGTESQDLMDQRGWNREILFEPPTVPKALEKLTEAVMATHERAFSELKSARSLLMPKLFLGFGSMVAFLLMCGVFGTIFYLFVPPQQLGMPSDRSAPLWFGVSAGIGAALSLIMTGILYVLASSRQSDALSQLKASITELNWLHERWNRIADRDLSEAERAFNKKHEQHSQQKEQALTRYQKAHKDQLAEIESRRSSRLAAAKHQIADQRALLESQRKTRLAVLESQHLKQREEGDQQFINALALSQSQLDQCQTEHRRQQAEAWASLKTRWEQSFQQVSQQVNSLKQSAQTSSPPWDALEAKDWAPAQEIPIGYTIGQHRIDLDQWPGAVSPDIRLAPRTSQLIVPATVEFPSRASLLLQFKGPQGRAASVQALQVAMLRLLTQIPPGKIRFTLIDPVGLGESFGGFMHLADVDELLVTSRIWTEASQIEARLADLTEHMENVLQTYLRNEFATIEDYNHHAGEVAEPYRFLVISDFPAKFSEIAASRLLSVITSGPRCGVYTLMSVDMARDIPQQLPLETAASHMTTYYWSDQGFRFGAYPVPTPHHHYSDPQPATFNSQPLTAWPVELTPAPEPEQFTRLVKQMAEASRDARRVEVSFDRIAPKEADIWSKDSRAGIDIPLGRAGATKLQHLKLGQGTSQHMLVAGKTGSGKSTFLHTLIINTALYYSPNEVNFYLIDFKKGVEFKDYAALQLPHGRVVAIESDREFGVSALQKLDALLQERGELFRKHGVQDIRGFRDANPETPLPRILLVIDEFQEFFVEDDKLAQTASLMMDRLVRQGRAFGIHVILGSQTLGGAYSLARSTLGQVAIRVALQCSEADAHLILSEENTAARLLTRPGEAIYNDANGMMEGNHPFQVAFLPDSQREELLRRLASQARKALFKLDSMIVFEGNIPSDPSRNTALHRLIEGIDDAQSKRVTPRIWLGDAVEIKQPTELPFPRQSGSHLLLIGQDSEAALGLMSTAVVSLAAQLGPEMRDERQEPADPTADSPLPTARILVFDGSPVDAPDAELWRSVSKSVPGVRIVSTRNALEVLKELTEEQQARDADRESVRPPIFVFVSQLSRFRDLRKPDDDYSFGGGFGSGEPAAPSGGKLFADLIANGLENGIHFILWCDSYNNLERWMSRQSLREMERRILFQMNAADSSNLIDSPVASRLGTHRALLHFQESGAIEKFRPYGLPKKPWLDWASSCLQRRGPLDEATDLDEFMVS
jgi:S-DNA-T family DNA segregation ATPase FtsK/SpoIIIE